MGVPNVCHVKFKDLTSAFSAVSELELAVLVGSRAIGTDSPGSDWDFAVQWVYGLGFMEQLAATEKLRKLLSLVLSVDMDAIDLIDLPTARLAMRAVVAEEGVIIHGGDTLAWCHFLQRTWRELEETYWEETYPA
ncbi:MAG: nucleotidyltransferase domain-containing protein [Thiomicrorhabdus sp.]|jgi:predicted nucleotidyltransferase|nr:nucleotidyltransferase domain-containing protein [Thiomicrorhabdus sp.]